MAKRLEEIAKNASPETNPRLNDQRAEYFRRRLDQPLDPYNRVMLQALVAQELLYAGKTEEAIEGFLHVQREVTRNGYAFPSGFAGTIRDMLAISHLRLAEQENCIYNHTIDSCLLPIGETGVHRFQRGSRAAIDAYKRILKDKPDDLTSRWLLNIAYMTVGEYPHLVPKTWLIPPAAFCSDYNIGRFYDAAPGLGLDVVSLAGGCITEDFDGDGYLDIVTSSWGLRDQTRYFRNEGDGTFRDCTEEAGLKGLVGGLNISQT
ncbi:MAG: VCBS repeat-containing protein, partial [Candidatus Latescibacteria bacterium]|nr:VCBS repeat-containing protein [Candidatus Latescibacterota bacterium]